MAKWLMDKNQQPYVTQEWGRLFPSIRGTGRRSKSSQFLRVGAGESSASATDTIVLQHGLTQNERLKKYGDQKQHQRNHWNLCRIKQPQEKLPVILLFFPV